MRMMWIGGWGVAPESIRPEAERYFAHSKHSFHAPTAKVLEDRASFQGADVIVGWSLGAWRLLEAASRGVEFPGMVLLFAPFVAFPAEAGLGGKCKTTQVKFLHRWLQREPLAALTDFFKRAALPEATSSASAPPYPLPDLLEGLERLSEDASSSLRAFAARGLPRNWQAFVGDSDPLLDGAAVCRSLPGCVPLRGVGHAIADLLAASQAK